MRNHARTYLIWVLLSAIVPFAYSQTNTTIINVRDFGAIGDGVSDDSLAFTKAINAAKGAKLHIPEGQYLIRTTLKLDSTIEIFGDGDQTSLIFNLHTPNDSNNLIAVWPKQTEPWLPAQGQIEAQSQRIKGNFTASLKVGDWIELEANNDPEFFPKKWDQPWSQNARGQMLKVIAIDNEGLQVEQPMAYSLKLSDQPRIRKWQYVQDLVLRNFKIVRQDAGESYNIAMKDCLGCRIQNITSENAVRTHLSITSSARCRVSQSKFIGAQNHGGGGHGYGVTLTRHASENHIIDNYFEDLRHAMLLSIGSNSNILAFNESRNSHDDTGKLIADISLHGHYSANNHFHQNVVELVAVSDYWGPVGLRNRFTENIITKAGLYIHDHSQEQIVEGNIMKGVVSTDATITKVTLNSNQMRVSDAYLQEQYETWRNNKPKNILVHIQDRLCSSLYAGLFFTLGKAKHSKM